MEEKLRFAICEGGRTVGAGVVASIIEYCVDQSHRAIDRSRIIVLRLIQRFLR